VNFNVGEQEYVIEVLGAVGVLVIETSGLSSVPHGRMVVNDECKQSSVPSGIEAGLIT
jgi:hypothetical protein